MSEGKFTCGVLRVITIGSLGAHHYMSNQIRSCPLRDGCLNDLGKIRSPRPLPYGRGSVTRCKHAAPETEPGPSGSGLRTKPPESRKRLSDRGQKCLPHHYVK